MGLPVGCHGHLGWGAGPARRLTNRCPLWRPKTRWSPPKTGGTPSPQQRGGPDYHRSVMQETRISWKQFSLDGLEKDHESSREYMCTAVRFECSRWSWFFCRSSRWEDDLRPLATSLGIDGFDCLLTETANAFNCLTKQSSHPGLILLFYGATYPGHSLTYLGPLGNRVNPLNLHNQSWRWPHCRSCRRCPCPSSSPTRGHLARYQLLAS